MRHGARTPQSTYPNDPYINQTFFPYGWGQLTNVRIKKCSKLSYANTQTNLYLSL